MSRSLTLRVTVAPASRHTRANVLSVGMARLFNRPERGQAARCLPKMSFSHLASVKSNGRRNLSNMSVQKCMGCTWNSGPVGEPWKTALRMLDFGQFRLRPAGRSRNWPKSKLTEVEHMVLALSFSAYFFVFFSFPFVPKHLCPEPQTPNPKP